MILWQGVFYTVILSMCVFGIYMHHVYIDMLNISKLFMKIVFFNMIFRNENCKNMTFLEGRFVLTNVPPNSKKFVCHLCEYTNIFWISSKIYLHFHLAVFFLSKMWKNVRKSYWYFSKINISSIFLLVASYMFWCYWLMGYVKMS